MIMRSLLDPGSVEQGIRFTPVMDGRDVYLISSQNLPIADTRKHWALASAARKISCSLVLHKPSQDEAIVQPSRGKSMVSIQYAGLDRYSRLSINSTVPGQSPLDFGCIEPSSAPRGQITVCWNQIG